MSMHVYHYDLPIDDEWHEFPAGGVVLVQPHRVFPSRLEVWIQHTTRADDYPPQVLRVFGTGHPIPDSAFHVGSVRSDPFVWHVYETEVQG